MVNTTPITQPGPTPAQATAGYGNVGQENLLNQAAGLGGSYQATMPPINGAAFQNPVGNVAPAWTTGMNNYMANSSGPAPLAQPGAQTAVNNNLAQQAQLAGLYQQQAQGNGPSLASVQAQQSGGNAYAQSLGMLSAGGGNPALAGLNARNANASATNQIAQTAVAGRTAEEQNALGQMGNIYGQVGSETAAQVGQVQNNNQFNAGQQSTQNALNAAQYNAYMQQLAAQNNNQFQAQQNLTALNSSNYLQAQNTAAAAYNNQQANQFGMVDAGLSAWGGMMAGAAKMSDESMKTDIAPANKEMKDFLDTLQAHKYKYKEEQDGVGTHFSVMAQELEKSEVGKSMVIDTPRGKMVDYQRGLAVYMAAAADLNKRVSGLENLSNIGEKHV